MKHLTVLVVIIAVTGVNLVFRNGFYNPAAASRAPQRAERPISVDRVPAPDLPAGKQQLAKEDAAGDLRFAADLNRDTARDGDVALARIAADCGNLLYEKALRSPDNPHLLNQAAQHYRACLSHEPTCRNAEALFRNARARLGQIERMAAQRESARSGAGERKSPSENTSAPAEKDVKGGTPKIEATTPVENPSVEKDDQKMVGPDGVIYKRNDKR